ncbi:MULTISPECIES: cell envelope protein SmpA [unclassified Pseudomonas]|uniref:cell envelope protein SmpA n=1 Tax=unclassified Pseudomonas TaxID=196821 RepID=UPI002AC8C9B2|nr:MULTISPECIES: cell envelope protein SmpA [unclassified Pseudomonas]MEB0048219.1 cell envelope protein SmpA [Pseudomonas sp. Dout3]MEB0099204.1 cell envelope protein SmpA [Pseudomonas sp. DC1.2]WPX57580.1 cell envelope protein SmpA [Pseudomonas sp. DC1.2]
MPSRTQYFLLTTLLWLPTWAPATMINRCASPDGSVTFTTMSCATGDSLSHQDVKPFTPGTTAAVMPEASDHATSGKNIKRREPTVVGQSEDPCANVINAKQRREAIINQRVISGMTQRDVESALGKPDKISIRNSTTNYRYELKQGRTAQVSFDEKGCVKGKPKTQTAKSPR